MTPGRYIALMGAGYKPREKRKQQQIFLLPSLKREIDEVRGKVSRSEWIERAIVAQLAREGDV